MMMYNGSRLVHFGKIADIIFVLTSFYLQPTNNKTAPDALPCPIFSGAIFVKKTAKNSSLHPTTKKSMATKSFDDGANS